MAAKQRTTSELEKQIAETFRKWHLPPPAIEYGSPRRYASRPSMDRQARSVTLRFRWAGKRIGLKMTRESRMLANLAALAKAVEAVRLAEVRGTTDLIVNLYRMMYPTPEQANAPALSRRARSSGPYAALHVSNDAPLEVVEAAYRALAKLHHPDVGGDIEAMKALNAAIEQIRGANARR